MSFFHHASTIFLRVRAQNLCKKSRIFYSTFCIDFGGFHPLPLHRPVHSNPVHLPVIKPNVTCPSECTPSGTPPTGFLSPESVGIRVLTQISCPAEKVWILMSQSDSRTLPGACEALSLTILLLAPHTPFLGFYESPILTFLSSIPLTSYSTAFPLPPPTQLLSSEVIPRAYNRMVLITPRRPFSVVSPGLSSLESKPFQTKTALLLVVVVSKKS